MTDKKSCDHQLSQNEFEEWNKPWNFCPVCGKPLKSSALDKLLLKTLGLEDQSEALNPGQSVEDALEAFFVSDRKDFNSTISLDKVRANKERLLLVGRVWEVGIRGMLFQDYSMKKALTKALLWAVTELTVEEVEELFQKV